LNLLFVLYWRGELSSFTYVLHVLEECFPIFEQLILRLFIAVRTKILTPSAHTAIQLTTT